MKFIFFSYFIIVFLIMGCGNQVNEGNNSSSNNVESFGDVNPSFNFYIEKVKNKLFKYGVNYQSIQKINYVSINYGEIKDEAVGVCNTKFKIHDNIDKEITSRKIMIDPIKWNNLNQEEKIEILAHELGHCAWLLNHLDSENQIMSPIVSNINEDAWLYFANQIKSISSFK